MYCNQTVLVAVASVTILTTEIVCDGYQKCLASIHLFRLQEQFLVSILKRFQFYTVSASFMVSMLSSFLHGFYFNTVTISSPLCLKEMCISLYFARLIHSPHVLPGRCAALRHAPRDMCVARGAHLAASRVPAA